MIRISICRFVWPSVALITLIMLGLFITAPNQFFMVMLGIYGLAAIIFLKDLIVYVRKEYLKLIDPFSD
jgi:hypothetical protein